MSPQLRQRSAGRSGRSADGSMSLLEHIRELRSRLIKAALFILVGFLATVWFAPDVLEFLRQPYCDLYPVGHCPNMIQLAPTDYFLLKLKIGMWTGLIVSSPFWLYQLWAFVAPGLHKHERRWAYTFVAAATPLFLAGAALAYAVVGKGLAFLLPGAHDPVQTQLEITRYVSWVTNFLLIFGVAFEFPLLAVMLNFAGLVSARKMFGWWRIVVFLLFAFAAIATPTPDPFVMTGLALCLTGMYFGAIGVAWLNDRRRGRRAGLASGYEALDDDETSRLDYTPEPVDEPAPVERSEPPRRYDDTT